MKFFRENFVLILGAALPLAFMLAFMALKAARERMVEPPLHAVVFAMKPYIANGEAYDIAVRNGALTVTFTGVADYNGKPQTQQLTLYMYDPVTDKLTKMTISAPDDAKTGKKVALTAPAELVTARIDDRETAPDGYVFTRSSHRNGNIFSDMFGYNGPYGSIFSLSKGGRFIRLPPVDGYGQEQFIGWIVTP